MLVFVCQAASLQEEVSADTGAWDGSAAAVAQQLLT